jgi:exopolysaccharide biosynthesis polyprenyl glycosylphosphotransferase
MFARRSQVLGLQFFLHDLLLTALAFLIAFFLRDRLMPQVWHRFDHIYPLSHYWPLLLGVLLLWALIGQSLGIYTHADPRNRPQLLRDALVLVVIGSIAVFAGLYLFKGEYVSRSLVLALCALDAVFLFVGRWCFFPATAWLRERLHLYRYFLIVGTGPAALEMASFLTEGAHLGQRLVGFIGTSAADTQGKSHADYPVFPVWQVPEILKEHIVDEVIIAVGGGDLSGLEPLMLRFQEEGIHTRLHLDFLPGTVAQVYLENFRDVPLLTLVNTPTNETLLFIKRVCDIVFSAITLLLLSPLLALVAMLVALSSPGPVLYRQTRCGIGGRRFTLFKFRTMIVGAEKLRAGLERFNEVDGPVFKMANDPRCTPVGRWLRKFSIDELPQLWNIFRGDMSFVGPRPPIPEEVGKYENWQRRRLRMRPGLTCLWALEGRNKVQFSRWMQLDLLYIDNWSLWLDLKILVKTIPYVLRGSGAF